MKTFATLLLTLAVFVQAYALSGFDFGPELAKVYAPYYKSLKKDDMAEKGMQAEKWRTALLDKELAKMYEAYYESLKKLAEAEKGLKKTYWYAPMLQKETLKEHGRVFPYYLPFQENKKEIGLKGGKEYPFIVKEATHKK